MGTLERVPEHNDNELNPGGREAEEAYLLSLLKKGEITQEEFESRMEEYDEQTGQNHEGGAH